MQSSSGLSRISSFIHKIANPLRSSSAAAAAEVEESNSASFSSGCCPAIIQNHIFMQQFESVLSECETNGFLSYISLVANDMHLSSAQLSALYEEKCRNLFATTDDFFQNVDSVLSTCDLNAAKLELASKMMNLPANKELYLQFIAEVSLILFKYVYRQGQSSSLVQSEEMVRTLIQLAFLERGIKEPENAPHARYAVYSDLSNKLFYKNDVYPYFESCKECKAELKAALLQYKNHEACTTNLWPVRSVIHFLKKASEAKQEAALSLLLINI